MATPNARPPTFLPGDLLNYKGNTQCLMISSYAEGGVNRYNVLNLDTRQNFVAFRHDLQLIDLDYVLKDLDHEDLNFNLPEEPPKKRFKTVTKEQLDNIAAQKTEQSTQTQTKWAVKLFRGK